MKRLIVNADDFAITEGVSRGILAAHHKGIVTSTSAMMGSPNAAALVVSAIQAAPRLGFGIHLTLSGTGSPVLPPESIPSLVRADGKFYPFDDWLARMDQFDADEIARELTAQVDLFVRAAGRLPDHLDAHHHVVYRHPAAMRTFFALAERYHIPIRAVESASLFGGQTPARLQAVLDAGPIPPRPARFDESFYDQTATLGDFLLFLTGLPDNSTTEIMCHPGYSDASLDSDYTTKREDEIMVLTHASVREVLRIEGIEVVNFAEVGGVR